MTSFREDHQEDPHDDGLIHVQIISPKTDDAVSSFTMDLSEGENSGIAVNGFHGSSVYTLTPNDTHITIQFIGVEKFVEHHSPKEEST